MPRLQRCINIEKICSDLNSREIDKDNRFKCNDKTNNLINCNCWSLQKINLELELNYIIKQYL
jgi:hypothetical protein